jgi:hypothetical protein
LAGPLIYAIPHGSGWLYVGQTRQLLVSRLTQHLRKADKASRWANVMVLPLEAAVTDAQLGMLERTGRVVLRPAMGLRWPAGAEIAV